MVHLDQKKRIKIIVESDGVGHLECIPWEPQHWINNDGNSYPKALFETITKTLYIDLLIQDTIDEVDRIIENMIKGDKT